MLRRSLMARIAGCLAIALAACPARAAEPGRDAEPAGKGRFPDFGFLPQGYAGRIFKLSQDYPAAPPDRAAIPRFFGLDFRGDWVEGYLRTGWKSYMQELRRYCFEGNVEADWRVEENGVRRWYHMPWQHYGPIGREGIRGMTKEAEVKKYQLASTQTFSGGQTYAVAYYNEFAAYTIGKVWKDHEHPDLRGAEFPRGSVICKLLFVDVPTEQVPSLVDPILWQGYICDNFASNNRSVRPLALIQMDVMVRDDRTPTGWLFGTYQYNGMMKRPNRWDNLVPVGVQWGNDEDNRRDHYHTRCPERTEIVATIRESVINEDRDELPATHLGWNGRLNGPVDNPRSSCMSCHATAQYPIKSEMAPFFERNPPSPGDERWMRWFKNYKCTSKGGGPFDEGSHPADFCIQLVQGIDNFHRWWDERGGIFASEYGAQGTLERPQPTRDRPETDRSERNDLGLQPKPLSDAPRDRPATKPRP
ncbi:MAG: hypothetical protein JWN86_2541 [Planctomycetota bacterium]|nr:hypothetical protein [Planctomycetota bacterium]